MNEWSKRFNALPTEVRVIACAVGHEQRIRDLERDKERWQKDCAKRIADIDGLIGRLRREIESLDLPPDSKEQPNDG